VRDFLKALGQARGAMSTGYNRADDNYSQNAKNSLEVALKLALKLDLAVSDITLLNAEFKAKATNTPYSQISMPNFSHADYEAGVRRARTLPIAQAQIEFEKTLEYCEQLHDEGISDIIEEINALENTHEDIMLKIVREHWRGQQSEILRDREKVEKIRAEIGLD
jgi:endonuclease IV